MTNHIATPDDKPGKTLCGVDVPGRDCFSLKYVEDHGLEKLNFDFDFCENCVVIFKGSKCSPKYGTHCIDRPNIGASCECGAMYRNEKGAVVYTQIPLKTSMVSHPAHYNSGKIEVIEALEDWKLNFHRANAVKYIARAGKKDPSKEVEDLEKAVWYLRRDIELLKSSVNGAAPLRPNEMNARGCSAEEA